MRERDAGLQQQAGHAAGRYLHAHALLVHQDQRAALHIQPPAAQKQHELRSLMLIISDGSRIQASGTGRECASSALFAASAPFPSRAAHISIATACSGSWRATLRGAKARRPTAKQTA